MQTVKDYLNSLASSTAPSSNSAYQRFHPPYTPLSVPVPVYQTYFPIKGPLPEPRVKSCYNCGSSGHLGQECRAETLDELTAQGNVFFLIYTRTTN